MTLSLTRCDVTLCRAVPSSATQLSMTSRGYSSKQASTVMMIYAFLEICSANVTLRRATAQRDVSRDISDITLAYS